MKRDRVTNDFRKSDLKQEEVDKLLNVIDALKNSPLPTLSDKTRHKIAEIPGKKHKAPFITFVSLGSAFAVLLVLVVAAQFAVPGSPLYGIKRGTEYIRALIQPSYKDSLINVRKQELEKLEKEQAPEALIEGAATEYKKAGGEEKPKTEQRRNDSTERRPHDNNNSDDRNTWRQRNNDSQNNRDSNRKSRDDNSRENSWSWR